MSVIKDMQYITNKQKTDFFKSLSFVYSVHLPGLEPGTTVPKTAVISISPQVRIYFILYKDVEIIQFYVIM